MFARISNSWQLVKASVAVLRADKELVIFPIIIDDRSAYCDSYICHPAVFDGLFRGRYQR